MKRPKPKFKMWDRVWWVGTESCYANLVVYNTWKVNGKVRLSGCRLNPFSDRQRMEYCLDASKGGNISWLAESDLFRTKREAQKEVRRRNDG